MDIKVSVIVPVYNMERYLTRCLDSLAGQTLRELQIILVDDGSTDRSPELCRQYAGRDSRFLVIRQSNQGQGVARNCGIAHAAGEYIGFVDADDYVTPEMYQRLYEAAAAEHAGMALAGFRQIGGTLFDERSVDKTVCCFPETEIFEGKAGRDKLMLGTVGALPPEPEDSRYNFAAWKNLYSRRLIVENGIQFQGERGILWEDLFFGLDCIARVERAVGVPGAYYCYCRNSSSTSKGYHAGRFPQVRALEERLRAFLSRYMTEDEFTLYTDRIFQALARMVIVQELQHADDVGADWKTLRPELREICGDPRLQTVLRRYPYLRLPPKQAAFAFCMRYRLIGLLRLLTWLRGGGKGNGG